MTKKKKKKNNNWIRQWLVLRPSYFVFWASILAYWNDTALHGQFCYDDDGSIRQNPIVNGLQPWTNVWTHDFWGTPLTVEQSHKSFRPITTLSFILNWYWFPLPEEEESDQSEQSDQQQQDPSSSANTARKTIRGEDRTKGTYSFHVVNVILHGIVSGLVTEAAGLVFSENNNNNNSNHSQRLLQQEQPQQTNNNNIIIAQLATGFLFGLHPVHAEAVSNITSRGELLMSFFFLLAFVSYTHAVQRQQQQQARIQRQQSTSSVLSSSISLLGIYVIPWLCMTLSVFSKEQGASTLMTPVLYDFVQHYDSVLHLLRSIMLVRRQSTNTNSIPPADDDSNKNQGGSTQQQLDHRQYGDDELLQQQQQHAWSFVRRATILGIQTILVCLWRYWLNGATKPDFIFDQNPAGFAVDRFTRAFSVSWVYCLYIYDAIYPQYLSIDWSGRSIPLIADGTDPRIGVVLVLWTTLALCLATMMGGMPCSLSPNQERYRRIGLQGIGAFVVCPFLLSSNLLVTVGLMKGDRVVYLPLMGFCLLEAAIIHYCCSDLPGRTNHRPQQQQQHEKRKITTQSTVSLQNSSWMANMCHTFLMVQLFFFCRKVHERNLAWSDPLRLWMSAYQVNPISHHTMYNCGYNLSLNQRYEEAEQVLRPIRSPHTDGTTTTFVYAMVMHNLERGDEVLPLIDRALEVVEERRAEGGVRNTADQTARAESNLLVAKGFCTDDIRQKARAFYRAVEVDPMNEYAVSQAKILNDLIERGLDVNDSELLKRIMKARKG